MAMAGQGGGIPIAIMAVASLCLVWKLLGVVRAARVRRRIRGRLRPVPVTPVTQGVLRVRPWRGPGGELAGYHRPVEIEIDDRVPPPPRDIGGVYGE